MGKSDPLQIAKIQVGPSGGELGVSICPGIKDASSLVNRLGRDLEEDVKTISSWNAKAALTLMETQELERFGVADIGAVMRIHHIEWYHLPIKDMSIPGKEFENIWKEVGNYLGSIIFCGGNILIHCRAGLGRSGMIAARILVELGWNSEVALRRVREVRPGAIETRAQEEFVLGASARANRS